jgi:hypothetical protein
MGGTRGMHGSEEKCMCDLVNIQRYKRADMTITHITYALPVYHVPECTPLPGVLHRGG